MKRVFFSVMFTMWFYSCSCQQAKTHFKQYLHEFGHGNLPILLQDTKSYNEVFNQVYDEDFGWTFKSIPQNFVDSFVCFGGYCNSEPGYYRYDYGVKFNTYSNNAVVLRKIQYEGETEYDFDLVEIILVIYSENGKIIDRLILGKGNDRWQRLLTINEDKINLEQLKITDPNINAEILQCELEISTFLINPNGKVSRSKHEVFKEKKARWDKRLQKYVQL